MERMIRRMPSGNAAEYCSFIGMESARTDEGFAARLYDSMEMLVFEGYTHFICDGSCASGLQAAQDAAALRRVYPELTVELVFPYDVRAVGCAAWVLDLMYQADVVTMISAAADMEAGRKLKSYLVRQGSLLLAASDAATGRVAPAVEQARLAGRQVTCIPASSEMMAMAV